MSKRKAVQFRSFLFPFVNERPLFIQIVMVGNFFLSGALRIERALARPFILHHVPSLFRIAQSFLLFVHFRRRLAVVLPSSFRESVYYLCACTMYVWMLGMRNLFSEQPKREKWKKRGRRKHGQRPYFILGCGIAFAWNIYLWQMEREHVGPATLRLGGDYREKRGVKWLKTNCIPVLLHR